MPVRHSTPIAAAASNNVEIMNGNGDLAKLSGFVAGYEKYVKTFTQYPTSGKRFCFGNRRGAEQSCSGARNPDSTSRL